MPQRVQLRRTKGWRKPEGAIVVSRPSRWGNPFRVEAEVGGWWMVTLRGDVHHRFIDSLADALEVAVDLFSLHLAPMGSIEPDDIDAWLAPLRGHDLACWCPLEDEHGHRVPCHADVLLELANR